MATMETDVNKIVNLIDDAVKNHLKDLIKQKLMVHADAVVEETAKQIAEDLSSKIEHFNHPTGEIKIHIWLGKKEKPTHLERTVTYTVEQG